MPRRKTLLPAEAAPTPRTIHTIHPTAIYLPDDVRALLHLRASSLRREIREGRLEVCKRCGRYFFTGEQLLAWLRGGTITRTSNGKEQ